MTSRSAEIELSSAAEEPGLVRRVVTSHDAAGRSTLLIDDVAANVFRSSTVPGLGSAVAWMTSASGPSNEGNDDAAGADVVIPMCPEVGGSIFRIADFPPDSAYVVDHDPEAMFAEIGGPQARTAGTDARHFWSHRTDSLDYAVVLEGEIWMIVDTGECLLRAGDVVVQRATGHAWSNRTDRRCRMAFILLGAPPLSPPVAPGPNGATAQ